MSEFQRNPEEAIPKVETANSETENFSEYARECERLAEGFGFLETPAMKTISNATTLYTAEQLPAKVREWFLMGEQLNPDGNTQVLHRGHQLSYLAFMFRQNHLETIDDILGDLHDWVWDNSAPNGNHPEEAAQLKEFLDKI